MSRRLQRPVNDRGGEGIIRHADRIIAPGNVMMASRSASFNSRFVGVSTQIMRVSGRMAAPRPSYIIRQQLTRNPVRLRTFSIRRYVPPYTSSMATIWLSLSQQFEHGGNGRQPLTRRRTRVPPQPAMAVSLAWRWGCRYGYS